MHPAARSRHRPEIPRGPGRARPHAVLDRLRAATGLPSDAALAARLGLHPQTLRDCRRDGHVPYGAIVTAARAGMLGTIDLHFIFTGTSPSTPVREPS